MSASGGQPAGGQLAGGSGGCVGWPLRADELAHVVNGALAGDADAVALRAVTDTRARVVTGDCFVALSGLHFDGCRFAEQAWSLGASVVVASRERAHALGLSPPAGRALVVVDDPVVALQTLAARARAAFRGVVVAITGSNGKTTVKEMARAALSESLRVSASPLSWNSQVGVALSLLQIASDAQVALIECGISAPGEMERLRLMVQPDVGVFVNVGDAHRETLGAREVTAREKAELFRGLVRGPVLVPEGETLAREALGRVGARIAPVAVALPPDGAAIPGLLTDAELALALARQLGVDEAAARRGLAAWSPAPMRLETMVTPTGLHLINDAYSADPESVELALLALTRERTEGRSIAVLGALAQLGLATEAAHGRVGATVARLGVDELLVVGERAGSIADAAVRAGMDPACVHRAADVSAAADALEGLARRGDRVLLKASRPERLERVAELLFQSVGPLRVYIDMERLAGNFDAMRRAVGLGVDVMAVVKSFGYGLDAVRLARTLAARGAAALAVAYADEGMLLRQRGVTLPILVQNVLPHELDKVLRYGLDAEVGDVAQLRAVAAAAAAASGSGSSPGAGSGSGSSPGAGSGPGSSPGAGSGPGSSPGAGSGPGLLVRGPGAVPGASVAGQGAVVSSGASGAVGVRARVHLKVDTGMGRSGCWAEDADALLAAAAELDGGAVEVVGLMTHLAGSDEPSLDVFTEEQLSRFASVVERARALGLSPRWIHAANSGAIARFPAARWTMVRTGIALFGCAGPGIDDALGLLPVVRLEAQVVAVKAVPPGASVGYGRTWVNEGPAERLVAVVSVGYNDGYPRHLSNRGWMTVGGARCPVLGRVCMDVTMVDVTDAPQRPQPGDEVTVYGTEPGEPSLVEMAELAGTIPYELLTRLSPRARRIYRGVIAGQSTAG